MQCSISGEPPNQPVVSPSGYVYEKALIQSYIMENGTDPITGQQLAEEDLVDIKSTHIPRAKPPSATSIPSLLASFQAEWDSLMLETFSLRKQLMETKQELSSALYQQDAAVRVIARLTRERDEARVSLSELSASIGGLDAEVSSISRSNVSDSAGESARESAPVSADAATNESARQPANESATESANQSHTAPSTNPYGSEINKTRLELSAQRKRGAFKVDKSRWTSIEGFKSMKETAKPKQLVSKVCHLAPIDADTGAFSILSGGDKKIVLFDPVNQTINQSFKVKGQITSVIGIPDTEYFAAGLKSGAVEIFQKIDSKYSSYKTFQAHSSASIQLAVLPYNDIVVSIGEEGEWALIDFKMDSQAPITRLSSKKSRLDCLAIHPDGALVALGNAEMVSIYDMTTADVSESVQDFECASSVSFSENGRWLGAASVKEKGVIVIYDLSTTDIYGKTASKFIYSPITSVSFDKSCQFLMAVSVEGVEIYSRIKKRNWETVVFWPLNGAVDATFGPEAQLIVAITKEGKVHTYGM